MGVAREEVRGGGGDHNSVCQRGGTRRAPEGMGLLRRVRLGGGGRAGPSPCAQHSSPAGPPSSYVPRSEAPGVLGVSPGVEYELPLGRAAKRLVGVA